MTYLEAMQLITVVSLLVAAHWTNKFMKSVLERLERLEDEREQRL